MVLSSQSRSASTGTLLAGSIVSNLIAALIRIEWICAVALVPAMIIQALSLSTHTTDIATITCGSSA